MLHDVLVQVQDLVHNIVELQKRRKVLQEERVFSSSLCKNVTNRKTYVFHGGSHDHIRQSFSVLLHLLTQPGLVWALLLALAPAHFTPHGISIDRLTPKIIGKTKKPRAPYQFLIAK